MDDLRLGDGGRFERRFDRRDRPWDGETQLLERGERSQMIVCPSCAEGIQISARRGTGECPTCHCSFRLH